MSVPRRTFLQWIGAAALVGSGVELAVDVAVPRPMLTWDQTAPLFPGLPLRVGLRRDAPGPCHVTIITRHGSATHTAPVCTLQPGQSQVVELPYPYDHLVAGSYPMELVALTLTADHQDRRTLGVAQVSGLRFGV